MFLCCSELLEDGTVATEIMKTKEQQELMILQQKITLPSHLEQQWHEGLRRILHESNTAKVDVFLIYAHEIRLCLCMA